MPTSLLRLKTLPWNHMAVMSQRLCFIIVIHYVYPSSYSELPPPLPGLAHVHLFVSIKTLREMKLARCRM